MKKISLLFVLMSIVLFVFGQENLIKDGKFQDTYFSVNDIYRTIPEKGKWYPYLTGDRLAVLSVVDDNEKGKVVKFQALSHVSYAYSYVGQRISREVKPGTYRVGVWAKSTIEQPLAVMNVYLRVKTSPQKFLFFKKADYTPEKFPNRSGALYQIRLTNEWKYYTFDFDLTETIDKAGNYNMLSANGETISIEKSNETDLSDFFLAISSTTKYSQFIFTDVSFTPLKLVAPQTKKMTEKKKKEAEKNVVENNLIKDGSFENTYFNVNDIYRTIADKGKWYPYLTSDRIAVLSIEKDEERGNVLKFQSLSNPSYAYGYVGQRIEEQLEPAIYRVGFWAKSSYDEPLPVINVYLRVNTSPQRFLFFKLDNFNVAENPNRSGAIFQRFLTPKWQYYTIDFDLSKTIDSAAPYKMATEKGNRINIEKSTRGDRKDLYLSIASTSRNTQFLITDISLTKVEK